MTDEQTGPEDAATLRRRRRAWTRAYHPDRGGDPQVFAAGLRALDAGRDPFVMLTVSVYRRRDGLGGVVDRWRRRREAASRPPRVQ